MTGESLPVAKGTDPVPGKEVPLGDRTCMAYMKNTSVMRGRGEMIVTATGMDTEIGHIANLLATIKTDKKPLQKQLDGLSKIIAITAGIALVLVVILGLVRGESFDTLFIAGVALAVTTIGLLQRIFQTTELDLAQWSICIGIAASLVVVEEQVKLVMRQRQRRNAAPEPELSASGA